MKSYFYQTILKNESNDTRFEKFCIDLCNKQNNIFLVPTSKSWDLGRDAREVLSGKKHPTYLCSTLNKDINSKVKQDIQRLRDTSDVDSLIYCCTQELSEHAIEKLKTEIQEMLSKTITIDFLGQIQLAKLSEEYEDIFKKYYGQDLQSIIDMLKSSERGTETVQQKGLRLALATFASDDATNLRKNLLNKIVIDILSLKSDLSVRDLAKIISDDFHLPKSIDKEYLDNVLKEIERDGLVLQKNGKWALTDDGSKEAKTLSAETIDHLLEGKKVIFNAIKELTGYDLIEDQANRVWEVFKDSLTEIFYSNGLSIVNMINAFITEQEIKDNQTEFYTLVEEMAARVSSQFSHADQAEEIKQAIVDIFCDRTSDAFQWLTSISLAFISICALGLEGTSASEIHRILKRTKVVIDTDLLITLLCEAEPDHENLHGLFKRWKAIGGEVYVAYSVLEEAAHHAWISENDYQETYKLFKSLNDGHDLHRYIMNAFVRSFKLIANGKYDYKHWNMYINQYRGVSNKDYSKILEICRDDFGFNILGEGDEKQSNFKIIVQDYLVNMRKNPKITKELMRRIQDKSERDARILASILQFRVSESKKGSDNTMSLITSSTLFRKADMKFRDKIGLPESILLVSAFSYLISLLPGAKLTIKGLKSVLFDFSARAKVLPNELMAMRVLKSSAQYDFPFSKRASLRRTLEGQLRKNAEMHGSTLEKESEAFQKPSSSDEDIKSVAETISKALDGISEESISEEQLRKTIQEKNKLQEENEALREQLRILTSKKN